MKTTKLLWPIVAILLLVAAISSCEKYNPFDVEEVIFPKDGGEMVIHTEPGGYGICIYNSDNNENPASAPYSVDGIERVSKDWLTVELDRNNSKITLSAEQNNTGKQRRLRINMMVQNRGGMIPVIQE